VPRARRSLANDCVRPPMRRTSSHGDNNVWRPAGRAGNRHDAPGACPAREPCLAPGTRPPRRRPLNRIPAVPAPTAPHTLPTPGRVLAPRAAARQSFGSGRRRGPPPPAAPASRAGTAPASHGVREGTSMRTRTRVTAAAALALVIFAAACESIFGPEARPAPKKITELPRELSAAEIGTLHASNAFGFELLRRLHAEDPAKTVFISPLSASMALGMTMNGANGETWEGMRTALQFGDLGQDEINASYRGLLDLLGDLDPAVTFEIGNSFWHRPGSEPLPAFRRTVESVFDAQIRGLDFADPSAAATIND